jgi:hypothetical protein
VFWGGLLVLPPPCGLSVTSALLPEPESSSLIRNRRDVSTNWLKRPALETKQRQKVFRANFKRNLKEISLKRNSSEQLDRSPASKKENLTQAGESLSAEGAGAGTRPPLT